MKTYRNKSIQSFSKNAKLMSVAVGAILMFATNVVAAQDSSTSQNETGTAFGGKLIPNKFKLTKGSIAVGEKASTTGVHSLAAGFQAKTTASAGTAVGGNTKAGNYASAFGYGAKATGVVSTAIGWNAQATKDGAIAIGAGVESKGKGSVTIGDSVKSTSESGAAVTIGRLSDNHAELGISIGYNNKIDATSTNTMILGNSVRKTIKDSVFLGDETAYVEKGETTAGVGKVEAGYAGYAGAAGTNAYGVVSVGDKGKERRIQNVAAGLVSKHSTDAINGSQLYATNERIEHINKELKAGIASAMAFKETPFVPGKWSYAAGAAHYGGEQAVAVSFGRTAESGNWSLSGGISKGTRGDVGFRVGVSGVFN